MVSACRYRQGADESIFKNFCLSNPHDVQACWKFFSQIIKTFLCRVNNEKVCDFDGSCMMLVSLCNILHKDFDSWWKHSRKKETVDETINYPLVYFLLGGTADAVATNFKSSVLLLYKWSVTNVTADLLSMRRATRNLVSICSMLLSHMDACNKEAFVSRGYKLDMSNSLAKILSEAELSGQLKDRELHHELAMIQPSWLSAAVSGQLLTNQYNINMSQGLTSVISQSMSLYPSIKGAILLENYCYKLCASQFASTIFRSYWHYNSCDSNKEFKTYKLMNKLEIKSSSSSSKVVKFEEVAMKQSSIIDTVNTLRDYANAKIIIGEIDKNSVTTLGALFFKMSLNSF